MLSTSTCPIPPTPTSIVSGVPGAQNAVVMPLPWSHPKMTIWSGNWKRSWDINWNDKRSQDSTTQFLSRLGVYHPLGPSRPGKLAARTGGTPRHVKRTLDMLRQPTSQNFVNCADSAPKQATKYRIASENKASLHYGGDVVFKHYSTVSYYGPIELVIHKKR
jgi:hypothetical protein